jgi:membrane protein
MGMIKSTLRLIGLLSRKIRDDHVAAYSAQAAFFIMISFFPFIMLLLSIIQFFPIERDGMLKLFAELFPTAINTLIESIINEIYETAASTTLISITIVTALWTAGKGFLAVMKGLNSVFEINETRHGLLLRAIAALYTLIFAVMIIATMVLFVFGNRLYYWTQKKIPVLTRTAFLIISLRTILGLLILISFFLIIYIFVPNRKTKLLHQLPGAMLCGAGWMGFSYAFSYYIDNFSNYSAMYGSLTAVVLFMLWLYFCMYLLFLGAEFNLFFENKTFIHKVKLLYAKQYR